MIDDSVSRAIRVCAIPSGSRIVVAASGGPDSTALLHALRTLAHDRNWTLRIGHVNHQLRGEAADADEAFVRRLAETGGLEIDVARVDTVSYAREHDLSIEAAARTLRYSALRAMLSRWPGDLIATGHTRDDQAETVLMRLVQGTGLAGLTGIRQRTRDLVRPMLAVTHEEVVSYLQLFDLPYRVDASNSDRRHLRNRIRADLLPLLERQASGTRGRLARTAHLLAADAEYLGSETERTWETLVERDGQSVSLAGWRALHTSLRRTILRRMLVQRSAGRPPPDAEALLRLEETLLVMDALGSGEPHPCGPFAMHLQDGRFSFSERAAGPATWQETEIVVPEAIEIGAGSLTAETISVGDFAVVERLLAVLGPWHALLDSSAIRSTLKLRPRRPGDRMRPLGAPGHRKVQDIMVDRRVPRHVRDLWPLVTAGDEVVWIPGVAVSETARISSAADVIHLQFTPIPYLYRVRIPRLFR